MYIVLYMMYSIVWMCIYDHNYIDTYDVICLIEILMAFFPPFQPSAAPAVGGIDPIQAWRLLRVHQKYVALSENVGLIFPMK